MEPIEERPPVPNDQLKFNKLITKISKWAVSYMLLYMVWSNDWV